MAGILVLMLAVVFRRWQGTLLAVGCLAFSALVLVAVMALFDVVGKVLEVPVHQLLGEKVRDWVPISWWSIDAAPEDWAAEQDEFQPQVATRSPRAALARCRRYSLLTEMGPFFFRTSFAMATRRSRSAVYSVTEPTSGIMTSTLGVFLVRFATLHAASKMARACMRVISG